MLNRYVKLVVGYFVYQSARDTAVAIQNFGRAIVNPEDDLTPLEYWGEKTYG